MALVWERHEIAVTAFRRASDAERIHHPEAIDAKLRGTTVKKSETFYLA
ncbi:MAG: hypothetical protein ACRDGM_02765 [bacterium]